MYTGAWRKGWLDWEGLQYKPTLSALGLAEIPNEGSMCVHVPHTTLPRHVGSLPEGSITQLKNTEVS